MLPYSIAPVLPVPSAVMRWNLPWMPSNWLLLMGLTIACDINYRKNLWGYGLEPHDVLFQMMQYSDIIFGDQNEWEVASGVPHIPFEALDENYVDRQGGLSGVFPQDAPVSSLSARRW